VTAPRIPRHLKFGMIALGVGFVITLGLFVDVVGRIQSMVKEKETESNPVIPPAAQLYEQTDPPMTVKIFFPGTNSDVILSSENQTIRRSAELANRARQILQKLLEGPKAAQLFPSIPKDTKLQEVLNEQATVYSIVNSLTYNLPEIRQVKILVGGAEKETLAGHCLLLPLGMDLSITDVAPPKEQVNHAD
jgi:sporulation and spore germination protein